MIMNEISAFLDAGKSKLPHIEYRLDEPMKNHTSFRVGAPISVMYFPTSSVMLADLYALMKEYSILPVIIGNGTNLLVDDSRPLEIVAIKTVGLDSIEKISDTEIRAGAGVSLQRLSLYTHECKLAGFEFAHGIPGTLGGAVSMNAGAYGREMMDVIDSSETLTYHGITTYNAKEHDFSYRQSRFTDTEEIIISSVIRLEPGDKNEIEAKMNDYDTRRRNSQPLNMLSAGSTFKRPEGGYAAALIEQAGLKGFSIGGALVSDKHAGFIVNTGTATYSDIMAVIMHIKEKVFADTGIELETENRIISCNGNT